MLTYDSPDLSADLGHPFIDVDEWRDAPVRHRYVHGGFRDSPLRFSFYLPPVEAYGGRFFQHVTPVPQSEHLAQTATGEEDRIGFAVTSGAYFVETNGGGPAAPPPQRDAAFGAYRANAAAAVFSREVARDMYGDHRPFGYAYGGSGGAYRTIGAAENTQGIWDGFVPYVPGSPMALPNVFSVRLHAQRVLREHLDDVVDAVDAGGSGDSSAGLPQEQQQALAEVTRLGFPPRSWFGHRTMGAHAFSAVLPALRAIDPTFFDEFWTVPGYLGADPGASVHADRLRHRTTVAAVVVAGGGQEGMPSGGVDESWQHTGGGGPAEVRLASPVPRGTGLAELVVLSGAARGARLVLRQVSDDRAVLDQGNDAAVLAALAVGDAVEVDTSDVLAAQTYHRHQVPPAGGYPVFDQFRAADGTPSLPQRPVLVGPVLTAATVGSLPTGRFDGRMIVVACLLDREAFPWQADWYRRRAAEQLGDGLDGRFRLWYVDNALHGDAERQEHPTRTVSYIGALHHALRDLAAWVEDDVAPPGTTRYDVEDGQVVVADAAEDRGGVQPVVDLTVDGGPRADVPVGAEVMLRVTVDVPPGVGRLVALDWDLAGDGSFSSADVVEPASRLVRERRHVVRAPGTTFVTVRATAQREGDAATPFARVSNLARVRLVAR